MSDNLDDDKTRLALKNLEPWARDEISRLDKQFHTQRSRGQVDAKHSMLANASSISFRSGFLIGLICGLLIAALTCVLLLPNPF